MSYSDYRNARQIDEGGRIDCEILHPDHGWIPYTLDITDGDNHVDNEDLLSNMRKRGDVKPFVPPSKEELYEAAAAAVRYERDRRLATDVDPLVMNSLRWTDLSEDMKAKVAAYRKELLAITKSQGFPFNVVWPTSPL